MSDTDETPQSTQEPASTPQEQPAPQSKTVEPERVSYDPDGNRYIRAEPDEDA